jgi:ArsR family transcriptional regulator
MTLDIIISKNLDMRELMESSNKKNAKIFKALCDEQRLKILDLLKIGKMCGCELLKNVDIGQSSLSYHMKILVESGIVESEQHGKWIHYNISESGSIKALNILKEITSTKE